MTRLPCAAACLLAAGLVWLSACDRLSREPDAEPKPEPATVPQQPSTPEARPKPPASPAPVLPPDALYARERLAKLLSTAPTEGSPPSSPVSWTPPSCPLVYRFQADLEMEVIIEDNPPMPNEGLRMAGEFTMSAKDRDIAVIGNGDIELSHVSGGVKRPGGTQPAGSLAEIRLRKEGRQWTEVDGVTTLWSAYGSFPGLVAFWPALPKEMPVGSTAPWTLIFHRRGDGARTEIERSGQEAPAGAPLPEPVPYEIDAEVEVKGWLDVAGQPAVVLVARWALGGSETIKDPTMPDDPDAFEVSQRAEAQSRYVVLASGRLLWAEVRQTTHAEMAISPKHVMKQEHKLLATASLIRACDGPVVTAEPPDPSLEESALQAFALLRAAAGTGDPTLVAEHLAPEVVKAHGEEAIASFLKSHVERLGVLSLGWVEMADDVRTEGDTVRIHMTGSARSKPDMDTTTHTVVEAKQQDGRIVITRFGTDVVERDEGWTILEVSAARLTSSAPP